jgi:hypothetical protein
VEITDVGGGLYVCGNTALLGAASQVALQVFKRCVRTVVCVGLVKDRGLEAELELTGIKYCHAPLKAGAPPFVARRLVADVKKALRRGAVLVVGETAGGPALRLARSVASGSPLPTRRTRA